jgi:hypothetical protein
MNDLREITSVMIVTANEAALRALRLAGVPLAKAQKIVLSKDWREGQRANVSEKVKKLKGAK